MANPRYPMMRMPLTPYGAQFNPRFQQRASDPSNLTQQFMLWRLANQIAQDAEKNNGGEVPQSTEEVIPTAHVNPYENNTLRPSPMRSSLSPTGVYNDMSNRMAAEEKKRWADARTAVQQSYANQPDLSFKGTLNQTDEGSPITLTSPYGTGSSFTDPNMSYLDFVAKRHHDKYATPQRQQEVIDDPETLAEIARITKQVTGRR